MTMTKELGTFEKFLIKQDHVDVGDSHKIWYGVFGNTDGIPVVMVHGGPGSQSKIKYLAGFDLAKYKMIMIDQRGCGSSLPLGSIENNTINDLVDDMEKIRAELGIDKWIVSAGSWGAAVALKYAIKNPNKVLGLFLVSIFLGRKNDVEWLSLGKDSARIFPDVWDKKNQLARDFGFNESVSAKELLELINTGDFETQQKVAAYMSSWEDNISSHITNFEYKDPSEIEEAEILSSKIFLHYESNKFFLEENEILNNVNVIQGIPTSIVHGRYDMVCPVDGSYELSKKLKNCKLEITNFDGHGLTKETRVLCKYMFEELAARIKD